MCVHLGLLAGTTTFDIPADKVGKAWLPKFHGDQLVSFQETRMSGGGMIMVLGDNRAVEIKIFRDIDVSLEGEDAGIILLVGES